MIATRVTTLWLKQPICFCSVVPTCRNMSATVQINFRYLVYLPRNVSYCQPKCQLSYLEMLGTYPVYQVYMKLSGIEMSYT